DGFALAFVERREEGAVVHARRLGGGCDGTDYARAMAYSRRNLNEGEEVVIDLHPHWWDFVPPASSLLAGAALSVASERIVAVEPADGAERGFMDLVEWSASRASWLLVLVCAIWLAWRVVQWSLTHFVVTTHRVIYREGVIARTGIEIPIGRVNNVNFHQSAFERIVGAGDLLIESGGEDGQSRFSNIRDPENVQNLIQRTIRRVDGPAGS
ncbi:MAG: PH domain-containing protein, partial [Actinobacteria bacterium]|nr:PH domain-containing protein [Actinomycetota bacterium]